MNCTFQRLMVACVVLALTTVLAAEASAATLYSETFDTDATTGDFDTTYTGFSHSTDWSVTSGVATASGAGSLYRTMTAYDFSNPLTISVDIGTTGGSGGQSGSIFFGGASGPDNSGIGFGTFWPSASHGGFVSVSDGFPRPFQNNSDISPDVTNDGTLYTFTLTISENASVSTDFDWAVTIDGAGPFSSVSNSGTAAKSALGTLTTFGVRSDGLALSIDNLTLTMVPEPTSIILSVFSLLGLGMFRRRRTR